MVVGSIRTASCLPRCPLGMSTCCTLTRSTPHRTPARFCAVSTPRGHFVLFVVGSECADYLPSGAPGPSETARFCQKFGNGTTARYRGMGAGPSGGTKRMNFCCTCWQRWLENSWFWGDIVCGHGVDVLACIDGTIGIQTSSFFHVFFRVSPRTPRLFAAGATALYLYHVPGNSPRDRPSVPVPAPGTELLVPAHHCTCRNTQT